MTAPLDIARLREVAEAGDGSPILMEVARRAGKSTAREFWATFDPPTVLALLDRLARVEALVSDWQANGNSRELGDPTDHAWFACAEHGGEKGAVPPVAKYRLTLTITGNSHDEIESELLSMTRGGYLLDSDYYKRDEFTVYGGRTTAKLEHANPDMTPEQYDEALDAWWQNRKAAHPTPPCSSAQPDEGES